MAQSYGPLWGEEERRKREEEALAAYLGRPPAPMEQPPAAAIAPPQQQQQQSAPMPMFQPDDSGLESIRAARDNLERDKPGFLGGNWGAMLAAFLDLGMNKGRSIPAIMGAAGTMANKRTSDRQRTFEDLAAMELQAKRGARQDAMYAQGMGMRQQDLGLQKQRLDLEQQRLDELKRKANGGDPKAAAELENINLRNAELRSEQEFAKSHGGLTPAQWQSKDDRASSLALREQLGEQSAQDRQERAADRQQQQTFMRDTRAQQVTAKNVNDYSKQNEYELKALSDIKLLDDIASNPKFAKDMPGVGRLDSLSIIPDEARSDEGVQVRKAIGRLANLIQRSESGAAAPSQEVKGYIERLGAASGQSEAAFRDALGATKDYIRRALAGTASGRENDARSVVRGGARNLTDLEKWVFGDAADQQAALTVDLDPVALDPATQGTPGTLPAGPSVGYNNPTSILDEAERRKKRQDAYGDLGVVIQ